ncbi:hypothetical protein Tco_0437987 [Tanacetum coccineum]
MIFEITAQEDTHCLMDEFDKFELAQDGEILESLMHESYGGNANKNAGRNINQGFNVGNAVDESNQIIQRVPRTESTPRKATVQCYNCNEKGHYLPHEMSKPKFIGKLTAEVMLMTRLQPVDENDETVPSYDAKVVSQAKDDFTERENSILYDILDLEEITKVLMIELLYKMGVQFEWKSKRGTHCRKSRKCLNIYNQRNKLSMEGKPPIEKFLCKDEIERHGNILDNVEI